MNDVINKAIEQKIIKPRLDELKNKIEKQCRIPDFIDGVAIRNYTVLDIIRGISVENVYLSHFMELLANQIFKDNKDEVAKKAMLDFISDVQRQIKPDPASFSDFTDDEY